MPLRETKVFAQMIDFHCTVGHVELNHQKTFKKTKKTKKTKEVWPKTIKKPSKKLKKPKKPKFSKTMGIAGQGWPG